MEIILGIVFGWLLGQLLNYFTLVLPEHRRLLGLKCKRCGARYHTSEYWLFRRRCSHCDLAPGWRDYLLPVLFALFMGYLFYDEGFSWQTLATLVVLAYFTAVIVIDLEHRLVMHPVAGFGAGLGLVMGFLWRGIWRTLLGGVVGAGIMLAIYLLGLWYGRWHAKRSGITEFEEALGFGDVTLSGVIGLFLGWPGIAAGLVLAVLLAGGVSLAILVYALATRRYRPDLSLAYAPYLALAALWMLALADYIF